MMFKKLMTRGLLIGPVLAAMLGVGILFGCTGDDAAGESLESGGATAGQEVSERGGGEAGGERGGTGEGAEGGGAIVETHGGTIAVSSDGPRKGVTVNIRLPWSSEGHLR